MDELEARLAESADARHRLIATDGVFSMDGYHAKLDQICDLADRYDALVLVDDSHAVGFVGPGGRGTHAFHDVVERVDVLTGTLGKAVGGASGGYVSGRAEIVELLRQRARPYLFSNSLAPAVVGASLKALDLIGRSDDLRERLAANTAEFRRRMTELGFDVLPGEHPIVPVMVGDAAARGKALGGARRARRVRRRLLVPGRADGERPDSDADVGRPLRRGSRAGGRGVRRRPSGAGCLSCTCPVSDFSRTPAPNANPRDAGVGLKPDTRADRGDPTEVGTCHVASASATSAGSTIQTPTISTIATIANDRTPSRGGRPQ